MGGDSALKPTRWRSIHEIPDSMVPQFSKRDPENLVYKTRGYVNFKKRQILFSQNDGVPTYLRTPGLKLAYYASWTSAVGLFFYNIYLFNKYTSKK